MALLLGLAVSAVLARLRFVGTPLSVDEGGYAAVARFWARGAALYRDVWVDRPQGLVLLYRGTETLLGPNAVAIRVLGLAAGAGAVSLLAALLLRLADLRTAVAGGVLLVVLGSAPPIEGFAANGELLASLPALAALLCFAVWLTRPAATWAPLATGAFAASAVLVKQSGYDAGAAVVLWLVLAAVSGWRPRREALRTLGLVALGAAAPLAAALVHGVLVGFSDWWFAVARYRLTVESVATGGVSARAGLLWGSLGTAWPYALPLALLAVPGLLEARDRGREALILPLYAAFSVTGFLLGGLFHAHYYIGLAAPFSALAGLGLVRLARGRRALARAAATVLLVPAVVASAPAYVAGSDRQASWRSTHDARILTDEAVGAYLRARTRPDEPIYALYADAGLYYAADRRPAYPYLWFLGVQRIPGAVERLRALLAGPHAPRYVAQYQAEDGIDRAVGALLHARYRRVATIEHVPVWRRKAGPGSASR